MTHEEIFNRLKEGNGRFTTDRLENGLCDGRRRDELSSGQSPYAIVLSCADSRVVPEHAFDAGLGELFVVRVAGNVANTDGIASIEYAAAHLGSTVIVVMGHQSCGAVTAAIGGGDNGYNLNHLLAQITPAVVAAGDGATVDDVVKTNAELAANDLVNRSEILRNAVNEGKVKIAPAYYNLASGAVDFL